MMMVMYRHIMFEYVFGELGGGLGGGVACLQQTGPLLSSTVANIDAEGRSTLAHWPRFICKTCSDRGRKASRTEGPAGHYSAAF